jgi:hypothetical protein
MRTGPAQIGAAAPWSDVTNSDQRYWIRTRRWKTPDYFLEYPPELFPALAHRIPLPSRNAARPKAVGDRSAGDLAITGR